MNKSIETAIPIQTISVPIHPNTENRKAIAKLLSHLFEIGHHFVVIKKNGKNKTYPILKAIEICTDGLQPVA